MRKARGSGAYLHSQLRDGCPAAPAVTISSWQLGFQEERGGVIRERQVSKKLREEE